MKFKKIASLLVSATMAFSAFAAVANAEEVKGTLELTTYAAYSAAEAAELGVEIPDTHGLFLIGLDFADIGPLSYQTSGSGLTAKNYGDKLTGVKIDITDDSVDFIMVDPDNSTLDFATNSGNLDAGGLTFTYSNTGVKTAFPTTKGTGVTGTENMVIAYVTAPLGTKVTPTVIYQVTSWGSTGALTGDVWYEATADEIALGEAAGGGDEGDDELTFTIAEGTIYANGTVWNCTVANAVDGLKSLTATFTDSEGNTKDVATTRLSAWGGAGETGFAIGVNTVKSGKTVNAITATITDGADATDTAEATAVAAN